MHGEGLSSSTALGAPRAAARRLTRCGERHVRWRGLRGSGLYLMQLLSESVLWGCLVWDVWAGVGMRTRGSHAHGATAAALAQPLAGLVTASR